MPKATQLAVRLKFFVSGLSQFPGQPLPTSKRVTTLSLSRGQERGRRAPGVRTNATSLFFRSFQPEAGLLSSSRRLPTSASLPSSSCSGLVLPSAGRDLTATTRLGPAPTSGCTRPGFPVKVYGSALRVKGRAWVGLVGYLQPGPGRRRWARVSFLPLTQYLRGRWEGGGMRAL